MRAEVIVVGGGIVGLATAMECLGRFPGLPLVLLEKETGLATHQSGHNSGVIHSGIYYRPGSLKAATCVAGARLLIEFCRHHRVPFEICGKVIIAADAGELARLEQLYLRGVANGVPGLSLVGDDQLHDQEPHARGIKAIHIAGTGIVDYAQVAQAYASVIRSRGGLIRTAAKVTQLRREAGEWIVETTAGEVRGRLLVTCGGLFADRLARMAGVQDDVRIIPFRGDYYDLVPARAALVRGLIYPVSDPALPFLGVHATRSIHGHVHMGPNAVLALKREGYRKTDVDAADVAGLLRNPGFWRMAARYWAYGAAELARAWSAAAFVKAVQRLLPEVQAADLAPAASGVRAQAVNRRGQLLDDFDIVRVDGAVHVRNVPSPAATASIRIGQLITDHVATSIRPTGHAASV